MAHYKILRIAVPHVPLTSLLNMMGQTLLAFQPSEKKRENVAFGTFTLE